MSWKAPHLVKILCALSCNEQNPRGQSSGLAGVIGVHPRTIRKWKHGGNISDENLLKLYAVTRNPLVMLSMAFFLGLEYMFWHGTRDDPLRVGALMDYWLGAGNTVARYGLGEE